MDQRGVIDGLGSARALACPPVGRTRPVASWRWRPRQRELSLQTAPLFPAGFEGAMFVAAQTIGRTSPTNGSA